MPTAKLTRTKIAGFVPHTRPVLWWDEQLAGFGLKLHPSGRGTWITRFRLPGSRTLREVAIGTVATTAPEMARNRAREILHTARNGIDLDRERRAENVRRASAE